MADILTKGLVRIKHEKFSSDLGLATPRKLTVAAFNDAADVDGHEHGVPFEYIHFFVHRGTLSSLRSRSTTL